MLSFARLSLSRQFQLVSFFILIMGMLVMGTWVGGQIERGVLNRTAELTGLYVDSLVGHHLPPDLTSAQLAPEKWTPVNLIFKSTAISHKIISAKLWGPDGQVLYTTDKNPPTSTPVPSEELLRTAFAGQIQAEIVSSSLADAGGPQGNWPRVIKTFAPVHLLGVDKIGVVAELQQSTEDLDREVSAAQQSSWAVVSAATLLMYLLLAGFAGRASSIISKQQHKDQAQVKQLTALVEQNSQLNERVQRAAARSTALNELFLHRLASDLHDGPCQELGLALLRIDSLADPNEAEVPPAPNSNSSYQDFETIRLALRSALNELRTFSTGLWLPELECMSTTEVAQHAIRDYEGLIKVDVPLSLTDNLPLSVPLPVKIALYRLVQEALMNGFRHAPGASQQVKVWSNAELLGVKVVDTGKGFDLQTVLNNGHLGLKGMRERVEMLGGTFYVQSALGQGTTIEAHLPLTIVEDDHGGANPGNRR